MYIHLYKGLYLPADHLWLSPLQHSNHFHAGNRKPSGFYGFFRVALCAPEALKTEARQHIYNKFTIKIHNHSKSD